MYYVSDAAAIVLAADAKAPRSVEEVMRETYPDATIDGNGRAHAPADGYIYEDVVYRGGEYLPFPEGIDTVRESSSYYRPSISVFVEDTKEVLFIEGTKAQVNAARDVAKAQQLELDLNKAHVGTVGKREVFELMVMAVYSELGVYGVVFTNMMRDAEGNPVVYKGSKRLAKDGDTVKIKATVKSHWVAQTNGRKATYISRPTAA